MSAEFLRFVSLHQRGIGKHSLQSLTHGVVPGPAAMSTAQTTKELLKNIIGPLGIDGYRARLAVDFNGIGKQHNSVDQLSI